MSDLSSHCLRLAVDVHARIEGWIGSPDAPDTQLTALLKDFAPGFSMIAADGQRLPAEALPALFGRLRGSRPGLKIDIDELAVLHAGADSVLLSYRERHAWSAGATQRRATALFVVQPGGQPQWMYLQETWA
ncbi:hypothetical protein IB268_13975 [Achromobacter sp. ACM01]|uniref:hypothetical protein n=1 Tax=Achromobacter sp. ACM01 TaxID=2769298 RepID=UPI001786AF2C|nr:hypothetical protein [Achromobacter sp. ACM01]MBD9474024.1 hypothetical protein [Achromobacter sp. ACM01]